MKRFLFISLLFLCSACIKDKEVRGGETWFQIQIESPHNIDCGFPEISIKTNQAEAYLIIGNDLGRYVALGLPQVNYNAGDMLSVRIRKPVNDEIPVCHALGFGWGQVYIADIR
jgi:hypothetical protein